MALFDIVVTPAKSTDYWLTQYNKAVAADRKQLEAIFRQSRNYNSLVSGFTKGATINKSNKFEVIKAKEQGLTLNIEQINYLGMANQNIQTDIPAPKLETINEVISKKDIEKQDRIDNFIGKNKKQKKLGSQDIVDFLKAFPKVRVQALSQANLNVNIWLNIVNPDIRETQDKFSHVIALRLNLKSAKDIANAMDFTVTRTENKDGDTKLSVQIKLKPIYIQKFNDMLADSMIQAHIQRLSGPTVGELTENAIGLALNRTFTEAIKGRKNLGIFFKNNLLQFKQRLANIEASSMANMTDNLGGFVVTSNSLKNLSSLPEEERARAEAQITPSQLTVLIQRALFKNMRHTAGEAEPPVMTYRTGRFVDSFRVLNLNHAKRHFTFIIWPDYYSNITKGYDVGGLVSSSIRDAMKQIFRKQYNYNNKISYVGDTYGSRASYSHLAKQINKK